MALKPIYSVIVPVYNEEDIVTETYNRLNAVMESMKESYELIFVNDGSRDETANIIAKLVSQDPCVRLINFARNFGHMPAITAGMEYAKGDAIIIIDADLQDPPEVLPDMAALWKQGYDVVYGKRKERKGETFFKVWSAKMFYLFINSMTPLELPINTGEFRLMDRKVCDAVNRLQEKHRYVRGMVSWVGFRQTAYEYVREERLAGVTKYPLRKMLSLAMDAITAFSYKPLKLATALGFLMSFFSFVYLIVILWQRLFTDTTVAGWASTVGVVLLTQGMVLMILGIIGEYIGRIFEEVKNRPIYIVREALGYDEEKS
ncbi:MAG: glycosyltransferase family 2 protein [Defluviitaleaceae bacterium]|nr:glycosyltransferase family 2 protein [Defluviitaleaceae bacterium]